jgi:hypothetical protein
VIHNPLLVAASDLVADIATKTVATTVLKVDGDEGKVWEFVEIGEEEIILKTAEEAQANLIGEFDSLVLLLQIESIETTHSRPNF